VLAALDRVVDRSIPTAAVGAGPDGRAVLFVNPDFFGRTLTSAEQRVAVLEHEVLHLALGHLRIDPSAMPDDRRRNFACDLVVNQYVTHALPRGAVVLEMFPGFPKDATCEAYYALLAAMPDARLPARGKKRCDGMHGRWVPSAPGAMSTGLRDTVESIVNDARQRAAREGSFNALPQNLREALSQGRIARGGDATWKRALRLFTARTLRTSLRTTTQRESRRFGAERTRWDGPIVPGLRRGRRPTLAVVLDTSGSISAAMLTMFFEQVSCIAATGAEVHIVECDNQIRRVARWDGTFPSDVHGRGGTDFDPVFVWMHREGRALNLSGCVYLTDGCGPHPKVRPPCPVLWAITPGGQPVHAFGPSIRLAP
jgi:predicted metal-dependent peptidase